MNPHPTPEELDALEEAAGLPPVVIDCGQTSRRIEELRICRLVNAEILRREIEENRT